MNLDQWICTAIMFAGCAGLGLSRANGAQMLYGWCLVGLAYIAAMGTLT
jgi:hypothetical protein